MILFWCAYICLAIGFFVLLTTMIGLMRFNNVYVQLHIAGLTDMFGLPLFLLGIALLHYHAGNKIVSLKTVLLIALIYCCLPISSYIIVKIAFFVKKVSLRK